MDLPIHSFIHLLISSSKFGFCQGVDTVSSRQAKRPPVSYAMLGPRPSQEPSLTKKGSLGAWTGPSGAW